MVDVGLKGFMSVGSIIRTKHCDNPNWVTNVIYAINNEYIEIDIGLEKDYVNNLIMVGDTMKCKYTTDEHEFTLTGWVSRIRVEFPQSITIKIHNIEQFKNIRDSYRFDVYLCSVITPKGDENNGVFAIMTNICNTGAAFVVKENIESQLGIEDAVKDNLVCEFDIYVSPSCRIRFEGLIKRKVACEKGMEYGVKIINMGSNDRNTFNEFLKELEKKDKEFYNKRSSFWSKHSKYNSDGGF
jgi:hypothetical protein